MKQKQHICSRFTYHLKPDLGRWWRVENEGPTRLESCMLPLQSSWLIFHSFLPKMLTHQLRAPGRVSAAGGGTAGCREHPCQPPGEWGRWRPEPDSKAQLQSWVKEAEPSFGCPLSQDQFEKRRHAPPKFCHLKDSKWWEPHDLGRICQARISGSLLCFTVKAEANINKGFLFLSCT